MPTREHIEALAAAMAARPLAYYRSGRMGDPPSVVAMQRRAQRLCAAISSDPAAQDAVLAALVEGGALHCGCAWCCTGTPREQRGRGHAGCPS